MKIKLVFEDWKKNGKSIYNTEEGIELLTHASTPIVRHTKVKGEASPFNGNWTYWSKRRGEYPETPTRVAKLIKKQKGICPHCGLYFTSTDIVEVDHIKPKSLNGKDTLTSNNKLNMGVVGTYSRASANRVVVEADFVLFIGTDLGGMITNFWTTPKIGIPAIQIDTDPEVMGRNYPLKVSILGDAKLTIDEMVERADPGTASSRTEWISKVKGYSDAWYLEYNSLLTSDAVPIRPERICHELSKNLPDDAVVVVDTGHGGMWMGGMYDLKSPKQNYMRSGGHLGWAFPAALGAKSAVPDRPVVCFTGDAGFWYHIGEIETAVRPSTSSPPGPRFAHVQSPQA